jgi:hypothetical protein
MKTRALRKNMVFERKSTLSVFFDGATRLFDVSQAINLKGQTPEERNREALQSDWRAVGRDLRTALQIYEQELKHAKGGK